MKQIIINLTPNTIQLLKSQNAQLYGFKAVESRTGGGAPTVWLRTGNLAPSTLVSWTEEYQAYTSLDTHFSQGVQIIPSFVAAIAVGQQLNVGTGGIGRVVDGGAPNAISILSETTQQFGCGISQRPAAGGGGGSFAPLSVFPLFSFALDVIVPLEKVLLLFSSMPLSPGTVVVRAPSSGVFVDLTGSVQRTVSFDINAGWSWGGAPWGQAVPPNSDLTPLLIQL
jgi:hypothetical protein